MWCLVPLSDIDGGGCVRVNNKDVLLIKPIGLFFKFTCQKSINPTKDTNHCSVLGNQQNILTFSQPIKVCDVAFARTANNTWPQDFMSLTFTYSFTISQDFCARKGNTTLLYTTWRYWTTEQYNGLEMLICSWNAFENPFKGSSPLLIRPFLSACLKKFLLQKLYHNTYHWRRGFIRKYVWYFYQLQLCLGSLAFSNLV